MPCRSTRRAASRCAWTRWRRLEIRPTPNACEHENTSRRIDVTANVKGRDLGSVAGDVEDGVAAIAFPQEYHPKILGEYAERQAARHGCCRLALVAAVGDLALLITFVPQHAARASCRS